MDGLPVSALGITEKCCWDAGVELSQRELIARAFAGDDVQAEFDEVKGREAEEEAPKVDAPSLLPGWGAWAGHQRTPGWMASAQDKAQRFDARPRAHLRSKGCTLASVLRLTSL